MSNDASGLWPGYDEASDDDLVELLESKKQAAVDPSNAAVDDRVVRELAQAITSHEWLKKNQLDGEGYREQLHDRANLIRSWRP